MSAKGQKRIVLRNRHVGFATGRKSRAQGEGSDVPPGPTELTSTPINHAMPSSIIASLVATARIGSGLRLKGSSAVVRPKRAAWLVTRRRGSDAIRSELERWASAIMNVGTVSAMRRFRASLCQELVDETVLIAAERYKEMLRPGVRSERRRTRETMSLAHRHHEIFLKKSARLEAWRH